MLQKYNTYRVLQEFFDQPRRNFHMREISRALHLGQPSVIKHLNTLLHENLIIKEKKGLYPTYKAHQENDYFKLLKKQNIILRITTSGIIDYINQKIQPNCIVLFGSAARGEDIETSDIDIFIQAQEKTLSLEQYEKNLKRKINPFFESNLKHLNKELLNNLINGQIINGYLKVL